MEHDASLEIGPRKENLKLLWQTILGLMRQGISAISLTRRDPIRRDENMAKSKSRNPGNALKIAPPPTDEPFDPLHYDNIAEMIELQLLKRPLVTFEEVGSIVGAGIYALYYGGALELYAPFISDQEHKGKPIYVGKAIPRGGRKGLKDFAARDQRETALARRLQIHKAKISAVNDLKVEDFKLRYLPLTPVWIALGENAMIRAFKPLWNVAMDGFGNNPLGKGRKDQALSSWDVLHERRDLPEGLPSPKVTQDEMVERVREYFARRHDVSPDPRMELDHDEVEAAIDAFDELGG